MIKKVLFIISIFSLSCSNDGNSNPEKTALSLVTGINCRQTADDSPLQLGNPNVLVNDKFIIYPNPANEVVNISAQEGITDVWLVPANPEKIYQNVNFGSVLNTNLYTEQSIISNSDFSLNEQFSNGLSMNIGTLEKGYYKVFVKIGGMIYWDNLYKYDNQGNNEEQFSVINNFWN